eukprot:CFRG1946T1
MLTISGLRSSALQGKLHSTMAVAGVRYMNARQMSNSTKKEPIVLTSKLNGVTTLTMNNPKRLNGWTKPMMDALFKGMEDATTDPETKALIITGKGKYYCAGVNLADTITLQHPQKLWETIYTHNRQVFDNFLNFPKPVLIAANGPAIGAAVTTATLSDGIIASESASFNTPFARLGVPPEGCSSVNFERIMGAENARKMLDDGWVPTAKEAKEAGFVLEVVKDEELMPKAQALAEKWIKEGKKRVVAKDLWEVNDRESKDLATAFLATPFLDAQYEFLKSKGKTQIANLFWFLKTTRPIWGSMLKQ